MRHFFSTALAIAPLAGGVQESAPPGGLIATAGLPQALPPGGLRTSRTTVALTAVAVAADSHLPATAGTVEKASSVLHRQHLPMRTGPNSRKGGYFGLGRALARGSGRGAGGRPPQSLFRCRVCLNGPDGLTDQAQNVTPGSRTPALPGTSPSLRAVCPLDSVRPTAC